MKKIKNNIPNNNQIKTIQTKNPSKNYIPTNKLNTPIKYNTLLTLNTIINSKNIIIINKNTNIINITQFYINFYKSKSYNKYIPYQTNTIQLYNLLTHFLKKKTTQKNLIKLKNLYHIIKKTNLYKLKINTPNPIINTLHYFHHKYKKLLKI